MIGSRSTDLTTKQNLDFSPSFSAKQSFSYSVLKENFTEFTQHVQHYEKLTEYDPNDVQGWTELGHSYQLNKEYFKSFQAYQQAVTMSYGISPNADLWFGIGLLYYRCGHYEWAESSFKAVLQIDQRFHNRNITHYKLARIYCRMGYHRRALMSLQEAQRDCEVHKSKRIKIILYAAICYIKVGETRNALSMYRKVLRLNRNDVKVCYYIAVTCIKLGKPLRAAKYLRRSKRIERAQDGILLEGVCSYLLGNIDKAQRKVQKAFIMGQESELILGMLGIVNASSFQLDLAFQYFNRVLEINYQNYEAQFNIAVLYDRCIQPCQAALAYNTASTYNVGNTTAYQRRCVLQSVGHNTEFPAWELPSLDVLLELQESPPVSQQEIPDIWLRFVDPSAMYKQLSMQQFNNNPFNSLFNVQPPQLNKHQKRLNSKSTEVPKIKPNRPQLKTPVAKKSQPRRPPMPTVLTYKRPPAPPPQTDRQRDIHRKQVAAAAKTKYYGVASEDSGSDDDDQTNDVEIGAMHQVDVPSLGSVSEVDPNCVLGWNPSKIEPQQVDQFIQRVRSLLRELGVARPDDFNEQKACSLIHAQNYDTKKAMVLLERHLRRNHK